MTTDARVAAEPEVPAPLTLDELKSLQSQLSACIRECTEAWLVVLASAVVSCNSGPESIVDLYSLALVEATTNLQVGDESKSKSQRIQQVIQETLVKGSVIFGIPPALDTVFVLLDHLRNTSPSHLLDCSHFVRHARVQDPIGSLTTPAEQALRRVYRHNLDQILDEKMSHNMPDLKFLTLEINYGFNLGEQKVLDWRCTELLVLAALVARNCRAEVLWHMRGALRAGWSSDDVNSVINVAKRVARRMGCRTEKVPTLQEVKEDSND